jgi:hypothetical protein
MKEVHAVAVAVAVQAANSVAADRMCDGRNWEAVGSVAVAVEE